MRVIVEFSEGKVKPVRFWRGMREYEVKNVPMIFERQDGGRRYMCFAVDTGGIMAELVMDKESLDWRMGKCEPYYT